MAYCTIEDLKESKPVSFIVALTNDEGGESIDNTRANKIIDEAGVLIDSYIGGRYTVPLTTTSPLIKNIAIDITIRSLYIRRPNPIDDNDPVEKKYREAIKLLENIQRGTGVIPGIEGNSEKSDVNYKTNKSSDDKVWTKEMLDQF